MQTYAPRILVLATCLAFAIVANPACAEQPTADPAGDAWRDLTANYARVSAGQQAVTVKNGRAGIEHSPKQATRDLNSAAAGRAMIYDEVQALSREFCRAYPSDEHVVAARKLEAIAALMAAADRDTVAQKTAITLADGFRSDNTIVLSDRFEVAVLAERVRRGEGRSAKRGAASSSDEIIACANYQIVDIG
jgi:hypothetical protein